MFVSTHVYSGEYLDLSRGEYYLRARHFNPTTGRFTQPDPFWNIHNMQGGTGAILQSANLFVFVMNNPVIFVDPLGLVAWTTEDQAEFERLMAQGHTTEASLFFNSMEIAIRDYNRAVSNNDLFGRNQANFSGVQARQRFFAGGYVDTFDYLHGRNELSFLGVHNAFGIPGVGHASILIFAGEGSEFWSHDNFSNTAWGGAARFVTIGGESVPGDGMLRGRLDRDSDANLGNKREMQLLSVSPSQVHQMFTATAHFNNNASLRYNLFNMNSNSFARGLLDAVGISYTTPRSNLPAWNTRIPAHHFGR